MAIPSVTPPPAKTEDASIAPLKGEKNEVRMFQTLVHNLRNKKINLRKFKIGYFAYSPHETIFNALFVVSAMRYNKVKF